MRVEFDHIVYFARLTLKQIEITKCIYEIYRNAVNRVEGARELIYAHQSQSPHTPSLQISKFVGVQNVCFSL